MSHRRLQEACIYLFPDPRDCRLLVANSGMDASQITFDEPPALRWQSVINEGEKQNTLHKLVPVLLSRYPNNSQLVAACAPWEAADPVVAEDEAPKTEVPKEVAPTADHEIPLAIVTETPTTITTTTQRKKSAVELVPLQVPADLVDSAYVDSVATVASLRIIVVDLEKRLADIEAWREKSR